MYTTLTANQSAYDVTGLVFMVFKDNIVQEYKTLLCIDVPNDNQNMWYTRAMGVYFELAQKKVFEVVLML